MQCRGCKSEKLQKFDGELTASLPDLKSVRVPPIYASLSVVICLDCGLAELTVPTKELDSFKKAKAALEP